MRSAETACVYLHRLWIQADSRHIDESEIVSVLLILPSHVQAVVDETGHTVKDLASQLQLDTHRQGLQVKSRSHVM